MASKFSCLIQDLNDGLLRASECGHLTTLKFLLESGACVDAVNDVGETALSIAGLYDRNVC